MYTHVENKQRYKHNYNIHLYSTGRYFKQSLFNKTLYLWDIVDWLFGLIKFNRNKLYDKTIWIASSFN